MTFSVWALLTAVGCSAPPASDTGPPTTGLVPVTLDVTRAGADCYAAETLELPADAWWYYRDGAQALCNSMPWYAWTDDGDCWEFGATCGVGLASDPFIERNEGDPPFTATPCGEKRCP